MRVFLLILILLRLAFAEELISFQAKEYFLEGVNAQKQGDFFNARVFYQKVFLVAPQDIQYRKFILNNIGVMLMQVGNLEEAEKLFSSALEIDPDYKPAK
ncbi:MAG: tetratricopeptide repeat protein, partial [Candidatus Omnitrophica bacterium]|nr:tetratricopeptide repeat protein [Candidatus Omnitrophota bacterium]